MLIALLASTAASQVVQRACSPTGKAAYGVFEYPGDRRCLAFEPARAMTGVWVNEFEGSSFHPGAVSIAQAAKRNGGIWLEMDENTALPKGFRRVYGHAYRLTFIGKRAKPRPPWTDGPSPPGGNGFGHMGQASEMILIDRIVRYEDLGLMAYR